MCKYTRPLSQHHTEQFHRPKNILCSTCSSPSRPLTPTFSLLKKARLQFYRLLHLVFRGILYHVNVTLVSEFPVKLKLELKDCVDSD